MSYIKHLQCVTLFLCLTLFGGMAFADDGVGQTIQIETNFHSFVGKPSWQLNIRDLDNGINIPYVFDITRGHNTWVVFTGSSHYLISASYMQISTFRSRCDDFQLFRISDFCHLESHGRIMRGESLIVNISGDLTPSMDGIRCHVTKIPDSNFTIVNGD